MSKCVLPAKLLLRNVYRLLKTRLSWRDVLNLDNCTNNDLRWWFDSLSQWNGVIVESKPIDCQLVTDASSIAWGAWTGSQQAQGFWNCRVAYSSSNFRELLAVYMGLMSFRKILRKKEACSDIIRQYNSGSFREQIWGSVYRARLFSERHPFNGYGQPDHFTGSLSVRGRKLESGPVVATEFHVRVDASSKFVSTLRSRVGTSSRGPLCIIHDNSLTRIQFNVLGSINSWSERACPNQLGCKEQL